MDQSDLHTVSRIQYSKHTLGMPQPWWQYSASESNSTFHIGEYAKNVGFIQTWQDWKEPHCLAPGVLQQTSSDTAGQ